MVSAGAPDPHLRLWSATGELDTQVPITSVGGTIRFAVGEPGLRSEVWRVWANRGHGDVYIAGRGLGGAQKYSLHESGDWRYAFTSEFFRTPEDEGANRPTVSRLLDQWQRPPEADGQVVLSIRVLAEDVSPIDDANLKNKGKISWIPAPERGHAVYIGLVMLRPEQQIALGGSTPIDVLLLSTNEGVLLIHKQFPIDGAVRRDLARCRHAAEDLLPPDIKNRKGEPALRVGIFGFDNTSGERFVWDTAYQ